MHPERMAPQSTSTNKHKRTRRVTIVRPLSSPDETPFKDDHHDCALEIIKFTQTLTNRKRTKRHRGLENIELIMQ